MKMKKKRFLGILLSLVMVLGMVSGMSLTAYAAETTVTWDYATFKSATSGFLKDQITFTTTSNPSKSSNSGNLYGGTHTFTVPAGMKFKKIEFATTNTDMSGATNYSFYSTQDNGNINGKKVTWTGDSESVTFSGHAYAVEYVKFTIESVVVAVDSVTLDKTTLSTILDTNSSGNILTATVTPSNAADKTVVWTCSDSTVVEARPNSNLGDGGYQNLCYLRTLKAGTATITVTATNGTNDTSDDQSATCTVTVYDPYPIGTVWKLGDTINLHGAWYRDPLGTAVYVYHSKDAEGKVPTDLQLIGPPVAELRDVIPVSEYMDESKTDGYPIIPYTDDRKGSLRLSIPEDKKGETPLGIKLASGKGTASNPYVFELAYKAAPTVTAPTAKNLTYTGSAQALVTAGEATGGKMYYALGENATTAPADNLYTTSIPKATNAGTYYVWYKAVSADENHTDSEAKCVKATIASGNSGATAPEKQTLTYNGDPQPLVKPGSVEGNAGVMEYALGTDATTPPTEGWSTEVPKGTAAGDYYVWYRIVGDQNHKSVDPVCIVVTIGEASSPEQPDAEQPAAPSAVAPAPAAPTTDYTLLASLKTSGKKTLKLAWTAVPGADGYDVFFGICDHGESQYLVSTGALSYKVKGLKKGTAYKAFVRAWRNNGGTKEYIGAASPDVHAIAGGRSNHYTNPKKISVKKKKMTLAVGGSKAIKAKLRKFSDSRNYLNHVSAKVRYYSSDRTVAVVDAKGRVTGVGLGKCTVFAVAENGLRVGVKVTVK